MAKQLCGASFFSARKMPDDDAFFTFANSGTGGCCTVQSAKSFSMEAFISAVLKSPQTPSITLAEKKYRRWKARRSLRETRSMVAYSCGHPKGVSLP